MRNWDSMKERWALYARSDILHLENHTNNIMVAHIKEGLKPEMELDGCVETLMFLQAVAEMNYAKKVTDLG
ncbi:hypothetical protein JG687_00010233 [Phytophthora cactorum]|uniref:Uncharacterized protein n=2 Tax=Phytophthora cactorum TaxID=29920 RepID=A0A8T1U9J0_9STRA|nr:hypothetical protein JG687_00010233 [Phytophthora cactorum]